MDDNQTSALDLIPSRIKYYLLDYKDKNMEDFRSEYGTKRLRDLDIKELTRMFMLASLKDLDKLVHLKPKQENNTDEHIPIQYKEIYEHFSNIDHNNPNKEQLAQSEQWLKDNNILDHEGDILLNLDKGLQTFLDEHFS